MWTELSLDRYSEIGKVYTIRVYITVDIYILTFLFDWGKEGFHVPLIHEGYMVKSLPAAIDAIVHVAKAVVC